MTDFADALKDGIAAHVAAEQATVEIRGVLDDCARQITEASDGKILAGRAQSVRSVIGGVGRSLLDRMQGVLPEMEPYDVLRIEHATQQGQAYELCSYELAPEGYPISLRFENLEELCFDQSSLEKALQRMLRHPKTGGKIKTLLERPLSELVPKVPGKLSE